jgi:hypothetical protein
MDLDSAARQADEILRSTMEIAADSLELHRWYQARSLLALLLAAQSANRASYTQLCTWVVNRDLSVIRAIARDQPTDARLRGSLVSFEDRDVDEQAQAWALLTVVIDLIEVIPRD